MSLALSSTAALKAKPSANPTFFLDFTKYLEPWLEHALKSLLSSKKKFVIQPIPTPNTDAEFDERFAKIFTEGVKAVVNGVPLDYEGLSGALKHLRDIFDLPSVVFTGSTSHVSPAGAGEYLVAEFFRIPIISIPENPHPDIEVAVFTTIVVGILEPKVFQINLLVNHDIVGPGHSTEKDVNF
ncbi:hypothetical protein SISNIDRAFT_468484 [Sistotremastrum niveocremeum HHB9708]|uniref:Uncharacterized protein n=1 Tax=Sistotremastrum niveocremeum HHB9708 TaxID=1314777 RepID=A0A164RB14_9AGAM|nr:hypothetical protein SISNIDRAFT_468484 [Sistotremastrum niveocremeum HHB9708]